MLLAMDRRGRQNMPSARSIAASPIDELHAQTIVLLRWVLIVATAYLVLFSRPLAELTPAAGLFIAGYLASNVVLGQLIPRLRAPVLFEWMLIVVDIGAVSVALLLSDSSPGELFVLYFVVLFLSALSERIGLIVGAAVLISVAHLYTMSRFVEFGVLLQQGYLLRIPFLFVVALFFNRVVHQARARERRLEERGARDLRLDLLSGLSHDLKNPLGVIDQLADLLLDGSTGSLSPQQADLARRIQTSARQVIVLSQNLIDAERIDAGRLEIQRRAASMTNVIGDALVVACNASEIKGVILQASIEPGLPVVNVDAVQMERVIANLVGNAIKFTPAGGRVHVIARHERDQLILSVSDTGPGIPADELPRLAERHFRGSGSRGVDGSGLGLFIVRAVVEAHGGHLRVASGGTCGTTVTVTLPIAPPGAHERVDIETPPPPRVVAAAGAV
jgi:signal transduction histidine kinase